MMDRKVETLKAHPAADAYRLMTDDELAELAELIRANGLRDPITVGIIGAERWIVDGRNREKACGIASVSPGYEEIEFADEAALRTFVLDRNERRNITKGQKAMARAMLHPTAETGRPAMSKKVEPFNDFDKAELSRARAVLAYSPEIAREVRDGVTPLKEASEKVKAARERREITEAQQRRLAQEAPDLATHVKEESLSLTGAITLLDERQLPPEEVIRRRSESVLSAMAEIGRHLTEAKEVAGDDWLPWLKTLGWSQEDAFPYMRVADQVAKREPLNPDLTLDFGAVLRLGKGRAAMTVYREAYISRLIDLTNAAITDLDDVPTIDVDMVADTARQLWPADERTSPWIDKELRVIADEVLRARYGRHLDDEPEAIG